VGDHHDHHHDHDHGQGGGEGGRRRRHHGAPGRSVADYTRDFFSNWSGSDLPILRRVAVTFRNRSKAYLVPPFEGCCGNYGQPGC
jgi:hypothetical protein